MTGQVGTRAAVLSVLFLALALGSRGSAGETMQQALRLEARIALGDVAGRIDHMAIDLARERLFVAELGNNSVSVVDLAARSVVHRITGLKEPQGVAYAQATDTLYVANRGDGSVRVFRGTDYALAARVELDSDADNIRVDGSANRIIVGYGDGGLAAIDMATNAKVGTMRLKGHPESFQLDPATSDVFVNLPDDRAIVVLDRLTGQQRTRWPMPYGGNFAMALDNETQRVLTVFRQPAKLMAFAKQTGGVADQVATCGDVDDLFLDAKRRRIYISCGEGFIDVLDASRPGYPPIDRVATAAGARTSLFVPELDRLFLAVRAHGTVPAAIWVFAVNDQ
jgi:YVTN family beta-propeller protein